MESVLLSGSPSKVYSLEPSNIHDVIEQWSSVPVESERVSPQDKYFCYLKGEFQILSVKMRFKVLYAFDASFADVCIFLTIDYQASTAQIVEMICNGFV